MLQDEDDLGKNLVTILNELNQIPLTYKEQKEALQKITTLGRMALRSHACTLTFIDLEAKRLQLNASAGLKDEATYERQIAMGDWLDGSAIDFTLFARGERVERYGLKEDGQGVINRTFAREQDISSVVAQPMKSKDHLIGYFNHFSRSNDRVSDEQKRLLEIFACQAVVTIERFEQARSLDRLAESVKSLSSDLLASAPRRFLKEISTKACDLLGVPICIVWKLDEKDKKLKIVATEGDVDDDYKAVELDVNSPGMQKYLRKKNTRYVRQVASANTIQTHSRELQARGWVSMLSAPMWVNEKIIGMLDVYTTEFRLFEEWERKIFSVFSNHAAVSIKQTEHLTRIENLNETMLQMSATDEVDEVLELVLTKGLSLVGCNRGWISRMDLRTGMLPVVASRPSLPPLRTLKIGQGVTGKALQEEKPIKVNDVMSAQFRDIYEEFWPDTCAEIAVPIVSKYARIRVGADVKPASKLIGVFNIESPDAGAFSQADEDILWTLASHAAVIIDKLESDAKFSKIAEFQQQLVGKQDWEDIFRALMKAVTAKESLGYDYVNVSLVNLQSNTISTQYLRGYSSSVSDEFKRMAIHELDSDDIPAHVYRSKNIEVPEPNDKRLDADIERCLGEQDIVRVYVPMIDSNQRVIGTVEAGYKASYTKVIYEQDIQVLKSLVDYAVFSLEQTQRGVIERVGHEFRSTIVGIKSNASMLQRRYSQLPASVIQRKFEDIVTDSDILLLQVRDLELAMGRWRDHKPKIEKALVFRDVIIKCVNQFRRSAEDRGFDRSMLIYNPGDLQKIPLLYIDKVGLTQVVQNLLTNSIKYAKDDVKSFRIAINVEETPRMYVIIFKDWGIGIRSGLEKEIFKRGFRTPEAKSIHVSGSGLGLTIARKIMQEFKGDLVLVNNQDPTEFHLYLPKSLLEPPK